MDERPPSPPPAAPAAPAPLAGHLMGGSMFVFCVLLWIGMNWQQLNWRPLSEPGGPPHLFNWYLGWLLLWASIVAGTAYGLFVGEEAETAGRRQTIWLGLAAAGAAGAINVLFGLSTMPAPKTAAAAIASLCFALTGVLLPTVCFLTLWRAWARFLVIVPIFTLSLGVFATVRGNAEPATPAGLFDAFSRE